jgi:hypothetical protein
MQDGSLTIERRKRGPAVGVSGGAKLGPTVAGYTAESSSEVRTT